MHRIDADGHVNNQFSEGNAATGQAATRVSAAWLNDLQENVCRAITGAGISLVKGNYNQLAAAIPILAQSILPDFAAPAGYIFGLRQGMATATAVTVAPGAVDINGKYCVLPAAITVEVGVPTVSGLCWRALCVHAPSSGDSLDASCFLTANTAASGVSKVTWGSGGWYLTDAPAYRVIGLYPYISGTVVNYISESGLYWFGSSSSSTVIDTTSPPTTSTAVAIGMPLWPTRMFAIFQIRASGTGPGLRVIINSTHVAGSKVGGTSGDSLTQLATFYSDDGTATVLVDNWLTSGAPEWLLLRVSGVYIPVGLAR